MWFYPKSEPRELPPLVLAYIGDAVYELYVRTHLVAQGKLKVNMLHHASTALVNAGAQARFVHLLEDVLTDEEKGIVRRGRNVKTNHVPKNADMIDYHLSTGFEALIGYLFLAGQEERLEQIMAVLFNDEKQA
ncbi:MAG: Mini-ribonuclease 3 [Peptococcia bacterium]|jgi:ribonuclease-3 family protein